MSAQKIKEYLFVVCSIFLVLSSVGYAFDRDFIPFVYAVSGAGVAVYLLTTPYKGTNRRLKRLNIQQTVAAVMLPLSSYLMFKERNEWFVCLFVSAVLLIYVIFIKEHEEKKEK